MNPAAVPSRERPEPVLSLPAESCPQRGSHTASLMRLCGGVRSPGPRTGQAQTAVGPALSSPRDEAGARPPSVLRPRRLLGATTGWLLLGLTGSTQSHGIWISDTHIHPGFGFPENGLLEKTRSAAVLDWTNEELERSSRPSAPQGHPGE